MVPAFPALSESPQAVDARPAETRSKGSNRVRDIRSPELSARPDASCLVKAATRREKAQDCGERGKGNGEKGKGKREKENRDKGEGD
jgi:hypothetical protein